MITIIAGTNRRASLTSRFAAIYTSLMSDQAAPVQFYDLADMPPETLLTDVYDHVHKPGPVQHLQDSLFAPAKKLVFIFPEYNGSVPGALKLLIDSMDPRIAFAGKKASLIGIASGRAGNLRGLDHLSSILHHMNVAVMPYLLPVSRVQAEFDGDEAFKESTLRLVREHISRTLDF